MPQNRLSNSVLAVILFLCTSCTTQPKTSSSDDSVSLGTARSLSKSSYTLGCVEAYVRLGHKKGSHEICSKFAEEHIKANVDRFFNDDVKE